MSDMPLDASNPPPEVTPLRRAREAAGLHVVALAAMLKVPVQRLEALESGRYHELPDITFARALASSVCRVLKVDPAPILASLPATAQVRLGEPEGSLNAPMPSRSAPALGGAPSSEGRRMPWALAVAIVVLVAAGVLWFFLPPRAVPDEALPAALPPQTEVPAVPAAEAPQPPTSPMPVMPAPAEPPAASVATVPSAPTPTPTPAAVPPLESTRQPTPVNPAESDVLTLRATESSWVQVTGASGRVLLQRQLQTGEQVSFSSDLPLAVVVGRADQTAVTVRGQPLDLGPLARNNVARFEVK